MHKKLAADLTSLAHSILQIKNKEDVFVLKKKAHEVYEKLSLLAYVEEYINNTPNVEHTKEELLGKIENIVSQAEEKPVVVDDVIDQKIEGIKETKEDTQEVIKHDLEEKIKEQVEELTKEESPSEVSVNVMGEAEKEIQEEKRDEVQEGDLFISESGKEAPTLEEELKDTIAVDVVANLFENVQKKSLNDKLQSDIQIGLNDRIAFVKNLFGGSQEDFNRVLSQLNTLKTEKEAKKFINKMVKPDYDWTAKEELEERFMSIVERKFG